MSNFSPNYLSKEREIFLISWATSMHFYSRRVYCLRSFFSTGTEDDDATKKKGRNRQRGRQRRRPATIRRRRDGGESPQKSTRESSRESSLLFPKRIHFVSGIRFPNLQIEDSILSKLRKTLFFDVMAENMEIIPRNQLFVAENSRESIQLFMAFTISPESVLMNYC